MKIFYIKFTLISVFAIHLLSAQTPSWQWALGVGGNNYSDGMGISTDASGNSYVTGYFLRDTIHFGNITLIDTTGGSMFIAKLDSAGNTIWANIAAGADAPSGAGYLISSDVYGNSYVTGTYSTPAIYFGKDSLNNPDNNTHFFIVKYDAAGNEKWVRGASQQSAAIGISTDAAGNIYVAGYYTDSTFVFLNDTLVLDPNGGSFFAKFDSSGNLLWIRGPVTPTGGYYGVTGISSDSKGNTYLLGFFTNQVVFGEDTLTGNDELFVSKYDTVGKVVWAKQSQIFSSFFSGNAICADPEGNSYITGRFFSGLVFDSDTINSEGTFDVFVAKFDPTGKAVWVQKLLGNSNADEGDAGLAVTADAGGNCYVTGYYSSPVIYSGNDSLVNHGQDNIFVVNYDASGNTVWMKQADASSGIDEGRGLSVDGNGNCYVIGAVGSATDTFDNHVITNQDGGTAFIARISSGEATSIKAVNADINPLLVYPNPSGGQYYFKGLVSSGHIEIYNALGQTVYTGTLTSTEAVLDLAVLAPGMYFYHITNAVQKVQEGKMVKE